MWLKTICADDSSEEADTWMDYPIEPSSVFQDPFETLFMRTPWQTNYR